MEILIVDDEVMVRGLLADMILEAEVCPVSVHQAIDGQEALAFCRAHPVDLVITDIKMPHMDGLELISRLREENGIVRIAVLSAYDDFTYMRGAMRHGALDYIPKSDFSREDVALLLRRTLADLELERTRRESRSQVDEKLIGRQRAFASLESGEEAGLLELLELAGGDVQVAAFQLDSSPEQDLPRFQILRISDEVLERQGLAGGAVFTPRGDYLLLYRRTQGDGRSLREIYLWLLPALDAALGQSLQLSLLHSCSLPREPGQTVAALCERAARTVRLQSYYKELLPAVADPQVEPHRAELLKSLRRAAEGGGCLQSLRLLGSFVGACHRDRLHPDVIRPCLEAATGLLQEQLLELDPNHRPQPELGKLAARQLHVRHREELESWMEAYSQSYRAAAEEAQGVSPVVRGAIAYIEQQYAIKLTLAHVAARVARNKTYLSQLFTKELGISFHEYLERTRIDQAVLLLKCTGDSLEEIARKTGFDNANYFSKVFRRVMEDSPMQYRKKHQFEQDPKK